jgi:phosphoglycerate dehydrogenase-like enzyme
VPVAQGSVRDLRLGVYGLGAIGRTFCELCQPLGARITAFDPFAPEVPGVDRAGSLEALFRGSEAIAVHAGLTPATRGSVTRRLLSLLPDHAVFINTARGELVDQEALFDELRRGRLRAGLDVLEGDALPADHPVRRWPNVIITSHQIGRGDWPGEDLRPEKRLSSLHAIALDNLRRFLAGAPPLHVMTPERYALST